MKIADWNDAYTNRTYIPASETYGPKWEAAGRAYREAMRGHVQLDVPYGRGARHLIDLFMPESTPRGLAVFVHGGYWLAFDKTDWSHLAQGARDCGWVVAMPSYTLAPAASVADITREVGQAIATAAAMVGGPIRLAGHSAGGHLVTRMACADAPLSADVQRRIEHVLSISGVHDLRSLRHTAMAEKLFRDGEEAALESPALMEPVADTRLTCWVGAQERPEFLRQNDLLANVWLGLGADTRSVHDAGRHHFDVIDGLMDATSPLTEAFIGRI